MKNRYIKRLAQKVICFTLLLFLLSYTFGHFLINNPGLYTHKKRYVLPNDFQESWYRSPLFELPDFPAERKDWHDYEAMKSDANRTGPGENGTAVLNTEKSASELQKTIALRHGFRAYVSDMISVNRSLPDVRLEKCRSKLYLSNLPTISVIIPCHNEYNSVLKRTLHSIVNRSPKELLREIIIVDDQTKYGYSVDDMQIYVEQQFPGLVKFILLPERKGLIYAKQSGAKIAKGDVLVFLDAHIECTYNWLPPLLEPIAIDDRISTSPSIDLIDDATFEYQGHLNDGFYGGFNWDLMYKMLDMNSKLGNDKSIPYKDPVMMGGLFAISRRFYWELGGYDEGLDIWGFEQFEMSFKIWMCGGMLLDVPCSRVAHVFRGPWLLEPNPRNYSYISKNIKRVAEVWMDEYKRFVYEGDPETYAKLDAGDLSEMHAIRKRLKCKSFKWFLDVVAPDVLEQFPPISPPDYANGAIQSVAFPELCLDAVNNKYKRVGVGVYNCGENLIVPERNQFWHLTWRNEILNHRRDICLDLHEPLPNASVHISYCQRSGGNQYWMYKKRLQWIHHGSSTDECLEIIKNGTTFQVVANKCNKNNIRMRWTFGYINDTALPEE